MKSIINLLLIGFVLFLNQIKGQEVVSFFSDEFNNDIGEWPLAKEEEEINYTIKDGFLYMENKVPNKPGWNLIKTYDLSFDTVNFDVSTKIKITKGAPSAALSLAFNWYYDNSQRFYFSVSGEGMMRVYKFLDGEETNLLDWTKIPTYLKGGINELKVSRRYNQLIFFVNGKEVYNTVAVEFYGNGFGFVLDSEMEIMADYLRITYQGFDIPLWEGHSEFAKPFNLGPNINSDFQDLGPEISPDGSHLYFMRQTADKGDEIYFSKKVDGQGWTKAQNIGSPLNDDRDNSVVKVIDGNTLLLMNGYNGVGMFSFSQRVSGEVWSDPVGHVVEAYQNNSNYVDFDVSASQEVVLMTIENEESLGERDIFVSFYKGDNTWSKPINCGNIINTPTDENEMFLAPDGKTLYFSSKGHQNYGGYDLFITQRLDDSWTHWSKPLNLGKSFNTEYDELGISFSAKGDQIYLVSNQSGYGQSDILAMGADHMLDAVCVLEGKVFDSESKQALKAKITYSDIDADKIIGHAYSSIESGDFQAVLAKGLEYSIYAQADGFFPVSEHIDLKTITTYKTDHIDLYLTPIKMDAKIKLNNVFFDSGKATLKKQSTEELNRVFNFLKTNPNIEVEIGGHTDNVGSDAVNLSLSERRANAVANFLIGKGLTPSRVIGKGYGESLPVESNDTPEGQGKNRRVEMKILKL